MKTVQTALDFADSRLFKSVIVLERNKPVLNWGSPPGRGGHTPSGNQHQKTNAYSGHLWQQGDWVRG